MCGYRAWWCSTPSPRPYIYCHLALNAFLTGNCCLQPGCALILRGQGRDLQGFVETANGSGLINILALTIWAGGEDV